MARDVGLDRLRRALAPRYEVEREVGRGGSARVYRAREPSADRDVAIKVLDPDVAGHTGTDRFLREIRVISDLDHPNVLPLLDSGDVDGIPYYVTPYVPGRSLRDRLAVEKQLPLDEVVRLAADVASALDHAHGRGIIHRDVKPGNVLLAEDRAVVADFGIMRALEQVADATLTTTGIALGSPLYMSPEQSTGRDTVDARSDVYGLACLLYETLVGEPPFSGATPQVVFAKKVAVPPAPPSKVRNRLPAQIDSVLEKGLAPTPADRFATAGQMAEALRVAARSTGRVAPLRVAAIAAAAAGVAAGGWWASTRGPIAPVDALDPYRIVIFPFEGETDASGFDEVEQLRDAIARWDGVTVVDPLLVGERVDEGGGLTVARAASLARDLGAGRFMRGTVSTVGDSLRIHGISYTSEGSGATGHDYVVRIPLHPASSGPAFAVLADELLFSGRLEEPGGDPVGTRSAPARMAFIEGEDALSEWALGSADSAFSAAGAADPEFAAAHLWTALSRYWAERPVSEWSTPATLASVEPGQLTIREREMSEAIALLAAGDLESACPAWRRLTGREPERYVAWFSLARCLAADSTVEQDPASPSGWSFRTSYEEAIEAYRQAFHLNPAILSSFSDQNYEPLLGLLKASGNQRRRGTSEGVASIVFGADPAWRGDSLAFVPWPRETVRTRLSVSGEEFRVALLRTRETFRDIVATWVSTDPQSADAHVALALALTMLGDPTGLDTLGTARALATTQEQRFAARSLEVWLRLALSAPSDVDGVRRSKALADSLLASPVPSTGVAAGLASLTGRAHRVASIVSAPGGAPGNVFAPPIRRWGPALMVFAAFGGPTDSLLALEARGWTSVQQELDSGDRERAIFEWLTRSATLAFAHHRFAHLDSLVGRGHWLLDAQTAWSAGDSAAARAALGRAAAERRPVPPANLTWDALVAEASLLYDLGDFQGAADWLDPTLAALPQASPQVLSTPERAAALVRGMWLRARIAEQQGDREAFRHWARVVEILWQDADPFLQPIVTEMRRATAQGRD